MIDWSYWNGGSAADVPALLVALLAFPKSEGQREPWFSIWSALAHQGDVYSASFALFGSNEAPAGCGSGVRCRTETGR